MSVVRLTLVVSHPNPGSLTRALAAAAKVAAEAAGARVDLHDLVADGFDPVMKADEVGSTAFADALTAGYAADLAAADAVIVVHPVWFFHVPAALKGWVERVVREGVAFSVDERGAVSGLLRARRALVMTTANGSPAVERDVFGDPVTTFWSRVVFGPAGVGRTERLAFAPVRGSSAAERSRWLDEAAERAAALVADLLGARA